MDDILFKKPRILIDDAHRQTYRKQPQQKSRQLFKI